MTVKQNAAQATLKLADAGVDTPLLDARLLLAWTLKLRSEDLIREPERELSRREQLIFDKAIDLRTLRRPLPYLTGEGWFYGRAFKVNRAVLIPRPETEIVLETALSLLRGVPEPRVADIGTGSGCIGITVAVERPESAVWATDLSEQALLVARKNARRFGVADRVMFAQGDLCSALPLSVAFDLLISNPPYIPAATVPELQPEVRCYEPEMALAGIADATGADGTRLHRLLLEQGRKHVKPGGWVVLELGAGQAVEVERHAQRAGYSVVTVTNDYAGIGRVVAVQV